MLKALIALLSVPTLTLTDGVDAIIIVIRIYVLHPFKNYLTSCRLELTQRTSKNVWYKKTKTLPIGVTLTMLVLCMMLMPSATVR